jgi:ornithine carbamoyltransferase
MRNAQRRITFLQFHHVPTKLPAFLANDAETYDILLILSRLSFWEIVDNALAIKTQAKEKARNAENTTLSKSLAGLLIAMLFEKRSTRTRVSTEAAVTFLGGKSMFLGKDDIQLGVNENLRDTTIVLSSMVTCLIARVTAHSDIEKLCDESSVPVINALSKRLASSASYC